VWQLKWELEDLSFRYLEPEVYKRIAQMLDERRVERQQYIARTLATLARELEEVGVKAEITGRPKHIYSIWNKMRSKSLDFSEVYDVRAVRIIVPSVKDCYTRSARCTTCGSRSRRSSTTTSRGRRETSTSRCTPR